MKFRNREKEKEWLERYLKIEPAKGRGTDESFREGKDSFVLLENGLVEAG